MVHVDKAHSNAPTAYAQELAQREQTGWQLCRSAGKAAHGMEAGDPHVGHARQPLPLLERIFDDELKRLFSVWAVLQHSMAAIACCTSPQDAVAERSDAAKLGMALPFCLLQSVLLLPVQLLSSSHVALLHARLAHQATMLVCLAQCLQVGMPASAWPAARKTGTCWQP